MSKSRTIRIYRLPVRIGEMLVGYIYPERRTSGRPQWYGVCGGDRDVLLRVQSGCGWEGTPKRGRRRAAKDLRDHHREHDAAVA